MTSKPRKSIAVFTSGGDAPGMNAAVRAVVRCGINSGADVYGIWEGYQGLVDGKSCIRRLYWSDVSGILEMGGTMIGSARCAEFRTREGRLKACKNLVDRGINYLICIGGDGSLTGANLFKNEWRELTAELMKTNQISKQAYDAYEHLIIVGMVGSIDNDFCGTDLTIGCDTALHRIIEAVDCLQSTAVSHQRSFVVEVMGRNCGWLAANAAVACGADYVLIPEQPPEADDWKAHMCEVLETARRLGHRMNLVIVSEGAIDKFGNVITSQEIKDVLTNCAHQDVRITVLGHVQRGGAPSSYDRVMSTTVAAEAVKVALTSAPDAPSLVIGIQGNKIIRIPLIENVQMCKDIAAALARRDFETARNLRGPNFLNTLRIMRKVNKVKSQREKPSEEHLVKRVGILCVGAPAAGMNSAVRAAARYVMDKGHDVVAFNNGFEGLMEDESFTMEWMSVKGWWNLAGCELGTNRVLPGDKLEQVAKVFRKHRLQGLVVVGGFEAYHSLLILSKNRLRYTPFCIPMVCVPATISNNVPGSEISLGSDTALNTICNSVDAIRLSANASRKRVFIVEVMGGFCSYLAVLGALATGSEAAYRWEDPLSLAVIQKDIHMFQERFQHGAFCGIILNNEKASPHYSTSVLETIYTAEGGDDFTTRTNVLGYLQQGHFPSPFDRVKGAELGALAVDHILEHIKMYDDGSGQVHDVSDDAISVVGFQGHLVKISSVESLESQVDFGRRLPSNRWWDKLIGLMTMFGKYRRKSAEESKPAES